MSKILNKEVKEVVTSQVRMLEGIECDICGKVIPTGKYKDNENRYFRVITGHHDWGSESCDSREYYDYDICPECINGFVTDYLGDSEGWDTRYIEVETKHCFAEKVMEWV